MIKGMNSCVLQLGSNLDDKNKMLNDAIKYISSSIGKVDKCSSLYESEPWGNADLNWFLNQIIIVKTPFKPRVILDLCKEIERKMGRLKKTTSVYENRLIDIDIIFFNNEVINESDLQIPHDKIPQRQFVLEPLVELIPHYVHPKEGQTVSYLLENCIDKLKVVRLGANL